MSLYDTSDKSMAFYIMGFTIFIQCRILIYKMFFTFPLFLSLTYNNYNNLLTVFTHQCPDPANLGHQVPLAPHLSPFCHSTPGPCLSTNSNEAWNIVR